MIFKYLRHLLITGFVSALVAVSCAVGVGSLRAAPVKVIFDSDMDSDCDDAAALAVLHALADKGEVEILATVTCGRNPWTPLTISALNTYYGRTNIPVGAPKFDAPLRQSKYTRQVAGKFPHALRQTEDAEDAVELYCRLLDQAEDNSVVVLTVGYLSNLSALLKQPTKGDRPSGLELVRRKVRQWACMGGNFIGSPARDDLKLGNTNFMVDKEAAYYVIKRKLIIIEHRTISVWCRLQHNVATIRHDLNQGELAPLVFHNLAVGCFRALRRRG